MSGVSRVVVDHIRSIQDVIEVLVEVLAVLTFLASFMSMPVSMGLMPLPFTTVCASKSSEPR